MRAPNLRDIAHNRFLLAQRIYRLVSSHDFIAYTETCNKEELEVILKLIRKLNVVKLRQMIKGEKILEDKNMKELRILGQRYQIKDYQYLSKASLLSAIRRAMDNEYY